jgi:hypothetical protein
MEVVLVEGGDHGFKVGKKDLASQGVTDNDTVLKTTLARVTAWIGALVPSTGKQPNDADNPHDPKNLNTTSSPNDPNVNTCKRLRSTENTDTGCLGVTKATKTANTAKTAKTKQAKTPKVKGRTSKYFTSIEPSKKLKVIDKSAVLVKKQPAGRNSMKKRKTPESH